jgi:MFS transporter, ACDE family, multidrug resistance protein
VAALLFARAVYAFNWYNVGAVLPLIGSALGATTPQLGIVLGSFLAGAALFQLPAGFAALRWGNRTVSILGLAIMGSFCLASAFSPSWIVLAVLRFGAGAGAGFFFAPALGLVTSYYRVGTRGPVVGLYNAGFSIGSGVGLFAGAFLGAILGWNWALAIGGIALLLGTAIAPMVLPETEAAQSRRTVGELWRASRPVLLSRNLWALSLSCMGLWTAFYVAAQYFVQYAHSVHPAWMLELAAGLPTLMIAVEVLGGPLGGWVGERQRDMRVLLGVFGVATGVAVLLIPFVGLAALVGVFVLLGFLDGAVFAIMYLLPTYLPEMQQEGLSLGLGLLNGIQIFVGSGLAIAFAFIAAYAGYTNAWVLAGIFAMAPLPLLFLVRGHLAPTSASVARESSPPPAARTDRPA